MSLEELYQKPLIVTNSVKTNRTKVFCICGTATSADYATSSRSKLYGILTTVCSSKFSHFLSNKHFRGNHGLNSDEHTALSIRQLG